MANVEKSAIVPAPSFPAWISITFRIALLLSTVRPFRGGRIAISNNFHTENAGNDVKAEVVCLARNTLAVSGQKSVNDKILTKPNFHYYIQ